MTVTATLADPLTVCCPGCGTDVLVPRSGPSPLDLLPVLPEGRCGACEGRGTVGLAHPSRGLWKHGEIVQPGDLEGRVSRYRTSTSCPVCSGSGRRGEPLGPGHVLMAPDGVARLYEGAREPWEAAHRRHRCAGSR